MTPELEDLFSFLRFPSVSTDSRHAQDVRACAEWLLAKLTAMGLTTELHETPKHPVVVARNPQVPGRRTVLVYGHYDVQPVDPLNLWTSDPFQPEIREGRIWARGATDNKGQMMAHVLGVEKTLREHGELPVNLIFLFEGEEEIGSPNLASFLLHHCDELRCDVIAISDTGMVAPGVPTLGYGLRGITCCEAILRGPKGDLHSGLFGGAVANPAAAMARLVASLHALDGRVAIDGFYDHVRPLEDCSKTVIPAEAFVKLSFRLVPDQTPKDIMEKVKNHLEWHCPPGVQIEIRPGHDGKPYLTDPNSKYGLAAQASLRAAFDAEPVLIREGGSIPIVQTFRDILGADTLLLGLALADAQIHAPNENFPVVNFEAGIRLNQALLAELAK